MSAVFRNERGYPLGSAHGKAVLTEAKVRAARAEHLPYVPGRGIEALARKYGCAASTMRDVLNFETWRHVR